MINQAILDEATDKVLTVYNRFSDKLNEKIVKKLVYTNTSQNFQYWYAHQVQESERMMNELIGEVAQHRMVSESVVREAFEQAGQASYDLDMEVFRLAGLDPVALSMNPTVRSILSANVAKTNGLLGNLSMTTAVSTQRTFLESVNSAVMAVEVGDQSYTSAIVDAIKITVDAGTRVLYPSGHSDQLDVATRRAVLTSLGQTTGEMTLGLAGQLGTDLVEVTAHVGARPSHQIWQGGIYSISGTSKRYKGLEEATGYGTGEGLLGWNCRHTFFPYFDGLSTPIYDELRKDEYESRTVSFNGTTYSYYEATQIQRSLERKIRNEKRKAGALDVAGDEALDPDLIREIDVESSVVYSKVQESEAQLTRFLDQTGLLRHTEREQAYY